MSFHNIRWLAPLITGVLLASGCATPTHRTAGHPAEPLRRVLILPIDAEVSELSAGGMTEKRDDWTSQVVANLNDSLRHLTPYTFVSLSESKEPVETEVKDIQALYRAITYNQFIHGLYGPSELDAVRGPLRYEVGAHEKLPASVQADATLLIFVRDDYATGGRKTVAALGALAGIPVRTGVIVSSAALATPDGRIVWMNQTAATTGDLRTPAGAETLVKTLFTGLPAKP